MYSICIHTVYQGIRMGDEGAAVSADVLAGADDAPASTAAAVLAELLGHRTHLTQLEGFSLPKLTRFVGVSLHKEGQLGNCTVFSGTGVALAQDELPVSSHKPVRLSLLPRQTVWANVPSQEPFKLWHSKAR